MKLPISIFALGVALTVNCFAFEDPTPTPTPAPTATPAPTPASTPKPKEGKPAININGTKKNDATFTTKGSNFRMKGLSNNGVDKIRWAFTGGASHTVNVGEGTTWKITISPLAVGKNFVQVWGLNSENGKQTGVHNSIIIRK